MAFDFITARRIIFGPGKISEVGEIAQALGKRVLYIHTRAGADRFPVSRILEAAGMPTEDFVTEGEPTIDLIQQGIQAAYTAQCDLVISVGGGSTIDTGKAIAAMAANPGDLLDYLEVVGKNQPLLNPSLPFIAIPTTSGTGSEVTRNAVIAVPEKKVKVSLRSPWMLPAVALVDPELTYSLPPEVTASTGMDALTQLLEPFVSKKANRMTDMICREGMARASRSIREAYLDGNHLKAREDMSWASLLGGMALANAALGAAHGFAGPIGGQFDAPHGALCARLLPPVIRVNVRALEERESDHPALTRYQEVAYLLTDNIHARALDGASWLAELVDEMRIPRLSSYGIREEDFNEIITNASRSSSMKGNPIELTHDELQEILGQAL